MITVSQRAGAGLFLLAISTQCAIRPETTDTSGFLVGYFTGVTTAPSAPAMVRRINGVTRGSTNTNVLIYSVAAESLGTDITYVNNAASGDSFPINTTGIYSVSTEIATTGTGTGELRVGSTVDNVNDDAKTRTSFSQGVAVNTNITLSWTGKITAGQSVWVFYIGAAPFNDANSNQITISKVMNL